MLELHHSEPNTFFLKPLIALHEKQVRFDSRWTDAGSLEQLAAGAPDSVEALLHLEREGPLLVHDGTVISGSFFMLEYIAETFPGIQLLPQTAFDRYRARASGQILGATLGSLVPVLGCSKYLAPRLQALPRTQLDAAIVRVEPVERRVGWSALLDGSYTLEILASARERLKLPISRIETTLAQEPWLAGPEYSIADIDAFALLHVLPDLAPEVLNGSVAPRTVEFLARIAARPAVRAAFAMSRSGNPGQHFVPGVEPSRWG